MAGKKKERSRTDGGKTRSTRPTCHTLTPPPPNVPPPPLEEEEQALLDHSGVRMVSESLVYSTMGWLKL